MNALEKEEEGEKQKQISAASGYSEISSLSFCF